MLDWRGEMKMTKWMTRIAICTAAPLPMSYSAIAQDSPEAIIVTGEYGEAPDSVRTLSQAVSYADMDLRQEAGRGERKGGDQGKSGAGRVELGGRSTIQKTKK